MNRVLLALAVGMFASIAWAQSAAPAGTGTSGAPQTAPADAGAAASKSDVTAYVTKQRKKAKKTTVKLGVKTAVVKQNP